MGAEKFIIKFWGVRGSIASPGPGTSLYGGHTSCVDLRYGKKMLILDAGTGLRPFGIRLARTPGNPYKNIHLFLSHFHIDHLFGLPYFAPLFQKGVTVNLYGPAGFSRSFEDILTSFFSEEFFPVPIKTMPARLFFHSLGNQTLKIDPFRITSFFINHPGRTIGYRIDAGHKSLAYVTDHEPITEFQHLATDKTQYEKTLLKRIAGADLMIHDAQFTNEEYVRHRGWGHSPWGYATRLAEDAGVRHLVLFHHAPEHKDGLLTGELQDLRRQLRRKGSLLQVSVARESETITL